MTHFRFIHTADLHLDSPFVGIRAFAPENVASALHDATFRAYEEIVKLCIEEQVDALLVAGDVYDSADRSLRAQLKFVSGLKQLDDAGIRSFVCHGNHDPLDGWEARLQYPPSCTRFGAGFQAVPVFKDDPKRAVVYGISYPTRNVYDNLARGFGQVDPDSFSIGLMHANVNSNGEHAPYAACSLHDLQLSQMNYWALGHVHSRQILSERSPTVVYPGNPQGRHPNESGARGVYLVEVDNARNVHLDFRAMDCVRWERSVLDISPLETEQDLIEAFDQLISAAWDDADGRAVVLRMTLTGRSSLHSALRQPGFTEDLLSSLNDEWAKRSPFAWCECVNVETAAPFDRQVRIKGSDFLAEVLKIAERAKADPELQSRLREGFSELYQHRQYRGYLSSLVPGDADLIRLIDEAEAIAVDLLAGDEI